MLQLCNCCWRACWRWARFYAVDAASSSAPTVTACRWTKFAISRTTAATRAMKFDCALVSISIILFFVQRIILKIRRIFFSSSQLIMAPSISIIYFAQECGDAFRFLQGYYIESKAKPQKPPVFHLRALYGLGRVHVAKCDGCVWGTLKLRDNAFSYYYYFFFTCSTNQRERRKFSFLLRFFSLL